MKMRADRPIAQEDEDLLARGPIVTQLATWVRAAPTQEGFVIGLTGRWGSGKTSVLNLLASELEGEATIVRFEPWLFSSADQLVGRFFDEISRQLVSGSLKKVGRRLARYGAAVSPAAQLVVGPAGQLLAAPGRIVDASEPSASTQRRDLRAALLKKQTRIVVMVDDIDRLRPDETMEVLRLVKLVADLPGVVYVLPYDRQRVEAAASSAFSLVATGETTERTSGREYLEKIVQVSLSLPPITADRLALITSQWIREALEGVDVVAWDATTWPAIAAAVNGYIESLRDASRLANVLPASLRLCGTEVASTDVVGLAAIRVFDPDVHDSLATISPILTGDAMRMSDFTLKQEDRDARDQAVIDAVLTGDSKSDATKTVLRALFPAAAHLLGAHRGACPPDAQTRKRVAARPVLDRYVHLALPAHQAPAELVETVLKALTNAGDLQSMLQEVDDAQLPDLLGRLRVRLDETQDIEVVEVSAVLMSQIPRMPKSERDWPNLESRNVLWVVEELVATIAERETRLEAARAIIASAPTLSLVAELITCFKTPEDNPSERPELDLLPAEEVAQLETDLASRAINASDDTWTEEAHPLWLANLVRTTHGQTAAFDLFERPAVLIASLTRVGRRPFRGALLLDLESIVELAGPKVIRLLERLASSEQLPGGLKSDLQAALADRRQGTAAPADP